MAVFYFRYWFSPWGECGEAGREVTKKPSPHTGTVSFLGKETFIRRHKVLTTSPGSRRRSGRRRRSRSHSSTRNRRPNRRPRGTPTQGTTNYTVVRYLLYNVLPCTNSIPLLHWLMWFRLMSNLNCRPPIANNDYCHFVHCIMRHRLLYPC